MWSIDSCVEICAKFNRNKKPRQLQFVLFVSATGAQGGWELMRNSKQRQLFDITHTKCTATAAPANSGIKHTQKKTGEKFMFLFALTFICWESKMVPHLLAGISLPTNLCQSPLFNRLMFYTANFCVI